MANAQKKNAIYIDTGAGATITVNAMKPVLLGMMICPSADNSRVVIKESASGTVVVDVKIVPTESRYLDFSGFKGIELTTTFEITTLTNITSVILYGSWNSPAGQAIG